MLKVAGQCFWGRSISTYATRMPVVDCREKFVLVRYPCDSVRPQPLGAREHCLRRPWLAATRCACQSCGSSLCQWAGRRLRVPCHAACSSTSVWACKATIDTAILWVMHRLHSRGAGFPAIFHQRFFCKKNRIIEKGRQGADMDGLTGLAMRHVSITGSL